MWKNKPLSTDYNKQHKDQWHKQFMACMEVQ